jgi:pimeloyl-ACP methyl ester carboxylesterase
MYPAGLAGITSRYVTLPDGVTVRVVESGPADLDRAVLLIHGWGGCLYSFAEMIPALTARGHRVVAVDLPGYGLSDKPRDERKYTTRYMSEAVALVAKQLGVTRFAMVGHSMGGKIALDEAVRRAPGLERLVLINPVGLGIVPIIPVLRPVAPKLVDRFTPRLVTRTLVRGILEVAFATRERPTARDVEEYWAPSQFDGYARACRATLHHADWRRTSPDALQSISLPVLVIMGGRDRLVRGGAGRAKHIPSARIVNIPEGGHIVMQECSDRTNEEITRFLGES